MSDDRPDEVDEARFALWGAVDEATRRVGERIEAEGADGEVAERVEAHRHLRDVMRRVRDDEPPADLCEWLDRRIEETCPPQPAPPPQVDVPWLQAETLGFLTAMRGIASSRLLACAFKNWELRAQIQIHDSGGCDVTGKLLGASRAPLAGYVVALYVDRALSESTVTDEFGQFSFDEHRGTAFGLRVGEGSEGQHVNLVDLAAEAAGPGALR